MSDYISNYVQEAAELLQRIDVTRVEKFVDLLFECWKNDGTVYLFGNGGSASTSQHWACDLFKCTWVEGKKRFRCMSLNDNMPLMSALTNDNGWGDVYVEQLKTWFRPGDVAIGISVHGGTGEDKAGLWSQNLLKALQYAKDNGGKALGLTGFDGGAMETLCDVNIVVPVESTPHTEGFHLVLEHLITNALTERIRSSDLVEV
ncbi:MAG: SIS domain-containing protein [Actinobacteria bacterium]|nr:SIS domain-containing protein [Actinomycetota bacterium]